MVPETKQFDIAIGDTVSDGEPDIDAGNLSQPGEQDIFVFEAPAGAEIFFDKKNSLTMSH
mgnify:CR=1 FL=1